MTRNRLIPGLRLVLPLALGSALAVACATSASDEPAPESDAVASAVAMHATEPGHVDPSEWPVGPHDLRGLAVGPTTGGAPNPIHHVAPVDPTRIVQKDDSNKQERKQFFREIHRAPPDVDWKAIERDNGRAQRDKRNILAAMSATGGRWTERGSDNQAGRMHVAQPSSDGAKLYAGSSRGGVWRADPEGTNWEPLGDNIYGGAHWLAVVPGAGPGDPDIMVRATDGGDVDRSTDDGATWNPPAGFPYSDMVGVRRVLVTADGSSSIFVVIRRWENGQLRCHLYRSTDLGASFSKVGGMNTFQGDVWASRTGPSSLYMLKDGELRVSVDNGDNWTTVGTPPSGTSGELCGSEVGAPRLYAIINSNGNKLYRSDDAGATWTYKTDVDDYWGTLNASTLDPDLFCWGGVEVHRSTDGGDTFDIINGWGEYYADPANKLHADNPGMDVIPDGQGGETWYFCTDGGLYESTDGGATVQNLSLDGLRVSQYYTTHTSTVNSDHVVAGAQDQGYQRADQTPVPDVPFGFDQLISGDYAHMTSGDGSHAWLYCVYPGFVLVHRKENEPDLYFTDFPPNESHPWLPFIKADPYDNTQFFFCAEQLYLHVKTPGSFSWTPTVWSTYDFSGQSGEYLTALEFSPIDPERAYAITNIGRLFTSNDHGVTWTPSINQGPDAVWLYGTSLVASSADIDTVYVGGSGYGTPAVWRSTDGGATYQPWGDGLPSTLVYGLDEALDGTGRVFAGTETSAYMRGPADAAWADIASNDAPVTTYWDVQAVADQNVMRFGTYGRGIWDYDLSDGCVYEAYGVGLGGNNTLVLDTESSTVLGTTHDLSCTGGLPSTNGYFLLGVASVQLPLFGGTLLVDPAVMATIPIVADANGDVDIPLALPADPNLAGVPVYYQILLRNPGVIGKWQLSNGLTGVWCE